MTVAQIAPARATSRENASASPRLARGQADVFVSATCSVWDLISTNTGVAMHPDSWLDSRNERSKMDRQTATIEERLNAAGIETRRPDATAVAIVGICTGKAEFLTPYRNCNLLPNVAAANRSGMLKAFGYFAKDRPYLRYIVATSGPRCSIGELRDAMQDLHRQVSRFAALDTLKVLGISVEYRGTEVTFKREQGEITCHPHANIVVNCSRALGNDWRQFLEISRNHFGAWVKDNGRLQDPAEAIKYMAKPGELLELNAQELAAVHRALLGLKLQQPMGAFAEQRRQHEKDLVKPAKRHTKEGDWKWVLVKRARKIRSEVDPAEPEENAVSEDQPGGKEDIAREPRNYLVSVTAPQPRFGPRMEPLFVVLGYQGDVDKLAERANLAGLVASARCQYAAAESGSPLSSTPARQLSEAEPASRPPIVPDPSKRQFLLKSAQEIAERTGQAWAKVEGPSLVERIYPELAKIQAARAEGNHGYLWEAIAKCGKI